VLKHFDGVQVGLTATPCIADASTFGDDDDKLAIRDTLRFFEVDRPTFSYKMKEAIRDGYLVPYQIYKAKTVKTAAEGGFEVTRDELDWSVLDATTKAELEKVFDGAKTITIDPAALERKVTIPERNRAMVREFRQVMDNGYIDAKGVLRKRGSRNIAPAVDKPPAHRTWPVDGPSGPWLAHRSPAFASGLTRFACQTAD